MITVNGEPVKYELLPEFCREIVRLYVEEGCDPGQGWMMILKNQLNAIIYCDAQHVAAMQDLVKWVHNYAPPRCHGSAERIQQWMIDRRREREGRSGYGPGEAWD